MLVVEPHRRLTLEQISRHRWLHLSPTFPGDLRTERSEPMSNKPSQQLDSVVVSYMLKLPDLTFDEIAESVNKQKFNHVFAIYHLLLDKINLQHREDQKLQQHLLSGAYSRYHFTIIYIFYSIC